MRERIELTTPVIKFRKLKWAEIWEGSYVVFTDVWNNYYLQ